MPFQFQCPSCKAVKTASERALGREIACPNCSRPVQLPNQDQLDAARAALQRKKEKLQSRIVSANPVQSGPSSAVAESAPVPATPVRVPQPSQADAAGDGVLREQSVVFHRRAASSADDMDMTPMVDVTFLLLIFFMITASFAVQKSIQRPVARKEDPSTSAVVQTEDEKLDNVTVQVDEFNAYSVISAQGEETASSKQDLIRLLMLAHDGAGADASKLVIQAHEDCMHVSVIDALDAGREAQFEAFEVTTVEQFD